RRAAVEPRLAVAGGADAHAVIDPGRNLDLQSLVLADAAHAIAIAAGIGDLLAGAMASRAGLLDAEETLLHTHGAVAAAGMARARRRAGLGARPVAGLAGFPTGDADLGIEAVGRLL